MKKIQMEDFKDEKGRFDPVAFRKAQVDNGERCTICDQLIIPSVIGDPTGLPVECYECKYIEDESEFDHSALVRCPMCGGHWEPDYEEIDLLSEEDEEMYCGDCDREFTVRKSISVTLTSPPLRKGGSK